MYMDEDVIADLKQFISATVSQQIRTEIGDFREYVDKRFDQIDHRFDKADQRFDKVEASIHSLSTAVAEAIHTSNDVTGAQFDDHERRIVHLEQKSA